MVVMIMVETARLAPACGCLIRSQLKYHRSQFLISLPARIHHHRIVLNINIRYMESIFREDVVKSFWGRKDL